MITNTQELIKQLLINYGENPQREGLMETPGRVEKMYEELLCGYKQDPGAVFKTFENENYTGLIKVENIGFGSLCEHHMIPFFGTVDITYRPNGRILGLSKFARLVDIFSRRLQVQERLTSQVACSIMENLHPMGCRVVVKAEHLCVLLRGVKKEGVYTTTECNLGEFANGVL
jgi:GTP cyclohydrolase IA